MAFKFDDDEHEITLTGSREPVKKAEIPIPESAKLPKTPVQEPAKKSTVLPKPPVIKVLSTDVASQEQQPIVPSNIITPQPIEVPQITKTEEPQTIPEQEETYYEEEYNPYEKKQAAPLKRNRMPDANIPLVRNGSKKDDIFDEDFGVQKRNPSEIQTNIFFTAVEPSPIKFVRPEEAKRRKEFIRQITMVRAGIATILIITIAAGVYSFIPKPGFSERIEDVNYALTETGRFRAAATAAENYALEFVHDFMERTENTEPNRRENMLRYLSPTAFNAVNSELPTIKNNLSRDVTVFQKVTSGPYVYRIENIDAAKLKQQSSTAGSYLATFTIRVEIQKYVNNNDFTITRPVLASDGTETGQFETVTEAPTYDKEWIYINVPVIYSRNQNEITLYGYPAFVTEPKNEKLDAYDTPFKTADWRSDDQILASSNVLKAQVEAFMLAWSKQNPNQNISGELAALLAPDATDRAKAGLNGKYVQSPSRETIVSGINVEGLPAETEITGEETRKALINVVWSTATDVEQGTVITYNQQYIILFRGTDASSYKIIDIKPRYSE